MGNILDEIPVLFMKKGFDIHNTSYNSMRKTSELRCLPPFDELPDSDSGKILKYFPFFFVIHKKIKADKGIFFVIVSKNINSLPEELLQIYKMYIPRRVLHLSRNTDQEITGKWLNEENEPRLLNAVFYEEFGL